MSDKINAEEQVKEMAKLSILSRRISEFQEKNLSTFPLVFFDNISSVKVDYDLTYNNAEMEKKNDHHVYYYLNIDESKEIDNLDKRFSHLEASVRNLFWKDINVKIYFNDREVYKSA